MVGSFSDFLEDEILDNYFGALDYAAPTPLYFALFTVDPSDSGGGTEVPFANGYARKSETNNKTTWATSSGGALDNAIAITFATASGGAWGTITAFGIFDASTAGNLIAWGEMTVDKAVGDGDTAQFNIGDLDITLD